ncbi:MAG TPA: type II toxin-antitoxin system VapC family toxin [Acidimicrobiales bacterium]|nr:type II toxin-antitoxin system VapC family toxin [Acidimicrobiales bacterium]
MNNVVFDASAGVEMLLRTPTGRRLQAKLPADLRTWVPEVYFTEVAGVLRRDEMHGRHDAARVALGFDRLLSAPVHRAQVRSLLSEAWALRHNLTVTDALYVALARHLDAPLVTTDLNLANTPNLSIATITP